MTDQAWGFSLSKQLIEFSSTAFYNTDNSPVFVLCYLICSIAEKSKPAEKIDIKLFTGIDQSIGEKLYHKSWVWAEAFSLGWCSRPPTQFFPLLCRPPPTHIYSAMQNILMFVCTYSLVFNELSFTHLDENVYHTGSILLWIKFGFEFQVKIQSTSSPYDYSKVNDIATES